MPRLAFALRFCSRLAWIWLFISSLNVAFAAQTRAPVTPAAHGAGPDWSAQVSADIQREEYAFQELTRERGVWSAPNRSQELRSRVSAAGLEVFPRTASADAAGAAWKLALRTNAFGRKGSVQELAPGSPAARDTRAEIDHGALHEWFENRESGIKHGWTIAARPDGVAALWIGLEVGGDLALRIEDGARSAQLVDARGAGVLHYRDLLVFDATGRALPAALESSAAGAGIAIDDADAVYPLTVDPLIMSWAWSAQSDQAGADFGVSVASAGDVNGDGYSDVLVGAYLYDNGQLNEGRVFVFHGSISGLSNSAAWTAEGNQTGAGMGISVGTAGDVNGDGYSDVIVSSWLYGNPQVEEGQALVFLGSPTGLALTPAWTAEGNHTQARFGRCVSTAGDVNGDGYSDVLVGAYLYDDATLGGRVYLYQGSAAGLSTSADWTEDGTQAGAQFGVSVSAAGDVNGDGFGDVIIGAGYHDNGQGDEGMAFVYLGSLDGLAASPAWSAQGDQVGAQLGESVASAGDVNGDGYADVIVGAFSWNGGQLDEGRALVYLGSASGLSASSAWAVESDQPSASFGYVVASAGDVNGDGYSDVLVGSWLYDNGQSNEGSAFLYMGSASGLSTSFTWDGEGDQVSAGYGTALAPAGDVNGDGYSDVIVGAWWYDDPQADEGRAFVYMGSPAGLAATAASTLESDQAGALFGSSVASAGDVNGDGFGDVIVGAWSYDNGEANEGRVFVFHGSASGLGASAAWSAESNQSSSFFGHRVAGAGDVNGDGYGDVIVGANGFDNGEGDEGRAFVYMGSPAGLGASAAWTAESNQVGASFGCSVASAGDVNGDGFADVIVGARTYDNGQIDEGRAYVYLGSDAGLATAPVWTAERDQANASFGLCVASAGDVNRDGFSDVIVGAPFADNGFTDEGRAWVFLGSKNGPNAFHSWTANGNQTLAEFGVSVASAGDVNGDGYSDVIVGADTYDNGQMDEGRAVLYLGSATGLAFGSFFNVESNQTEAYFGSSVASAGDVNADGYGDVIIGAFWYDNGQVNEGRAYLYMGSSSGLVASAAWTGESDQVSATYGGSVASAGDVNGDGYGDVIVGAYAYANGQAAEGRTYLYLGNEGRGGWTRSVQQRQNHDNAPISLLCGSDSKTEFRLRLGLDRRLTGFEWAGTAPVKARLECQVALLGAPFTASPLQSGSPQSAAIPPIVCDELFAFTPAPAGPAPLAVGTFRWRARLRTNNPLFPVTPWVSLPGNNVTEAKLRVLPLQAIDQQ